MKTTERLALALEKAGAPKLMIENARAGRYDDFQSESATPIRDLVTDLQFNGLHALAQDAIKGKFDEENGQVILTDAALEPMAEVLLHRLVHLPLTLTDRQKRLGKALYRFIADRNDRWLLTAGKRRMP